MTNGDDARNLCNLLNSQSRSPANIISPPILNNHRQTSEYTVCNNYWQHIKFQSLVHAVDSNKQRLQIEFCSDITRLNSLNT